MRGQAGAHGAWRRVHRGGKGRARALPTTRPQDGELESPYEYKQGRGAEAGPVRTRSRVGITRSRHSCALTGQRLLPQNKAEDRSGRAPADPRRTIAGATRESTWREMRGGAALAPQPPRTANGPPAHIPRMPSRCPPLTAVLFALTSTRGSVRRAAKVAASPLWAAPCRGVKPPCKGRGGEGFQKSWGGAVLTAHGVGQDKGRLGGVGSTQRGQA